MEILSEDLLAATLANSSSKPRMDIKIDSTFVIRVKQTRDGYTIEACGPDGIQVAPHHFELQVDEHHERILESLTNKAVREARRPDREELKQVGKLLYDAVFTPEISAAFRMAQAELEDGEGIRIRLELDSSTVASRPWEMMYSGEEFLALQSRFPLVRGVGDTVEYRHAPVWGRLRVLYAWADPEDDEWPKLDLRESAQHLQRLVSDSKRIKLDILENATWPSLKSHLLKDYHVLCFAGHGNKDGILLEGASGAKALPAENLGSLLEGKSTRLVLLMSCQSGAYTVEDVPGYARQLVQRTNVPAVAAMQFLVDSHEVDVLTTHFFEALAHYLPVDAALSEARKALLEEKKLYREIFAPVLYLQTETGKLFYRARDVVLRFFAIVVLLLILLLTALLLRWQMDQARLANAEEAEAVALSDTLLSRARELSQNGGDLGLATLLVLESINLASDAGSDNLGDAQTTLRAMLSEPHFQTTLAEFNSDVREVAFSYRGRYLASVAEGGSIQLWDVESPGGTPLMVPESEGAKAIAFSPDGALLAAGVGARQLSIWTMDNLLAEPVNKILGHVAGDYHVTSMEFSPNGEVLAAASEDGDIYLLKVQDLASPVVVLEGGQSLTTALAFSSDSSLLFAARSDRGIKVWDIQHPAQVFDFLKEVPEGDYIQSLTVNPSGDTLVGAGSGVFIWSLLKLDVPPYAMRHAERLERGRYSGVKFSPDGNSLAVASNDTVNGNYTIKLWDASDLGPASQPAVLPGHRSFINSLAFSADGKYLARSC